jgi:hypothetical protein
LCRAEYFALCLGRGLFWSITGLVGGIALVLLGGYVVLSPKEAILREGDKLIFCFLFRIKEYSISELEYVCYEELGHWLHRDGGIFDFAILKNDVRILTVTVRREGVLEHFMVYPIEQASAVAVTLMALKNK